MRILFLFLTLFSSISFGNSYYTPSGNPAQGAALSSIAMRNEFSSIGTAFNKLPDLTALPINEPVITNSAGTALVAVSPSSFMGIIGAQPLSSSLTSLSGITPSSIGLASLSSTTNAQAQTSIGITSFAQTALYSTTTAGFQTAVGLGTSSLYNVGTAANNVVQLNGSGVIPSLPGMPATQGAFKNLSISATGTNSTVTISADMLTVYSPSTYTFYTLAPVSLTGTTGTSATSPPTAGSLDTGNWASNTWYSEWVIYNGTSQGVLFSTQTNAPSALPTGYTAYARVGWFRTASSGSNALGFVQKGRKVKYIISAGSNLTALPLMASGTSAGANISVANFIPPTSSEIIINMSGLYNGNYGYVAPNSTYANYGANSAPLILSSGGGTAGVTGQVTMSPEGSYPQNIWWNATGSTWITCYGYEDNI